MMCFNGFGALWHRGARYINLWVREQKKGGPALLLTSINSLLVLFFLCNVLTENGIKHNSDWIKLPIIYNSQGKKDLQ